MPRRLSERFAETAIDNAGEDSLPARAKRWWNSSTQIRNRSVSQMFADTPTEWLKI